MRQQSLYIYLFSLLIILFSLLMVQVNGPTNFTTATGAVSHYEGVYSGDYEFAGEGKAITYEKRIRSLAPGQLYEIDVVKIGEQRELPFEKAEFMVKKRRREAMFSFRKGASLPTSANAPPLGKVYSYGQIAIISPQDAGDALAYSDIENSAVTFSVDKKRLDIENADPNSVDLHYLSGGSWQDIPLTKTSETNWEHYYKAQVPFGIYALTYELEQEEPEPVVPTGPVCGNGLIEAGENCQTCPADVKCPSGQNCQAGVCVAPPAPVRQAPVQRQVAPPVVQQPQQQGTSIWIWILIPAIIVVLVLIIILIFKKPHEEEEGGFDDFSQPSGGQPTGQQPGIQPMKAQPSQQPQMGQQPQQQPSPQPSQQPQRGQQSTQQTPGVQTTSQQMQPKTQPINQQQNQTNNVQNHAQASSGNQHLEQVKNYINQVSQKGFKKEQIKSALVSKGWPDNLVDKAFQELGK